MGLNELIFFLFVSYLGDNFSGFINFEFINNYSRIKDLVLLIPGNSLKWDYHDDLNKIRNGRLLNLMQCSEYL